MIDTISDVRRRWSHRMVLQITLKRVQPIKTIIGQIASGSIFFFWFRTYNDNISIIFPAVEYLFMKHVALRYSQHKLQSVTRWFSGLFMRAY